MAFRSDVEINPEMKAYIDERIDEFDGIAAERKERLREIAAFVEAKVGSGHVAKLTFICTHNSRRSHMAQIWAQTAAIHFGIPSVEVFSGGTEATAFNPRAVAAVKRVGVEIEKISEGNNPRYRVGIARGLPSFTAYSKIFTEPPNPPKEFAALMTCSQADEACPYVGGAELRVSIPYEDPKAFDGTALESEKYDERCRQIAREVLYLFSLVDAKP